MNRLRLLSVFIILAASSVVRGVPSVKKGFVNVNQTSLYYEMMGSGSPLVFISGGGTLDCRGWDDQFETFAKSYKVIRYDIRGIGKSVRPHAPFSHSKDLFELLKFLKIKKAHVIGLSFGGGIAIDFALEHPAMVDRLILAATGTSSDAKSEANLQGISTLSALAKKEGLERVLELILDTPSFISKENSAAREKIRQIYLDNRDVFESDFALVKLWQPIHPEASERLSEIHARALIIEGENDNPSYKVITDKLLKIRGSKKIVIPGAAHMINLDKPKEFNDAVLEFLRKG